MRNTYSVLREKIIGVSLKFNTDVPLIYEQIITSKYKERIPSYFNFLKEYRHHVISKIEENNNLRTLLFFLEQYEIIFTSIEEYCRKDKKLKAIEKEYFNLTFNFALVISIEFKLAYFKPFFYFGVKNAYDFVTLPTDSTFEELTLTQEEIENNIEINAYSEIYTKKYLDENPHHSLKYFKSIFNYFTGSSSFIYEDLEHELNPGIRQASRYPIFNELFQLEYLNLTTTEIKKLMDEMLSYVDNAKFRLWEYTAVFEVVTKFLKIHANRYENLVNRFKKGIDKWALQYNHVDYPDYYISIEKRSHTHEPFEGFLRNPFDLDFYPRLLYFKNHNESKPYEPIEEIEAYCLKVNEKIQRQNENEEIKNLYDLFKNDWKAFVEKLSDQNNSLRDYPIYSKFNYTESWPTLDKLINSELVEFGSHLEQRYQPPFDEDLKLDKFFLEELSFSLRKKVADKKKNLQYKPEGQYLLNLDIVALEWVRDILKYIDVDKA